jgi:hypothetical protein
MTTGQAEEGDHDEVGERGSGLQEGGQSSGANLIKLFGSFYVWDYRQCFWQFLPIIQIIKVLVLLAKIRGRIHNISFSL